MQVTFINPSMNGRQRGAPMEPLAISVLSGLTPADWSQRFHDETVAPIPFDEPTDLVAITAHTFTARRAYQIARKYRARGVPVVMGGYHPTLAPDEVGHFADAVVVGEAEGVWGRVLADAAAGDLRRIYSGGAPETLAGVTYDRRIFAGKRYRHIRSVQFGRGCRGTCDFCSVHRFFAGRCSQRPVAELVEEIRGLPPGHLFIVDDNLYVGRDKTAELLEALIPLRRRWTCQASIDIAEDPVLVDLLARSGCHSVLIGFESTTPETLARMRKGWNGATSRYEEVVNRLHARGILVFGTFVFGYDDEPLEAFDVCGEFVMRSRLFLAAFNLLQPTPGTPTYDRMLAAGQLVDDRWWLAPRTRFLKPVFTPRGMTSRELEVAAQLLRSRIYSRRGIFSRLLRTGHVLRSPTRVGFYLLANFRHRGELKRLGFEPFGDPADLAPIPVPAESDLTPEALRLVARGA